MKKTRLIVLALSLMAIFCMLALTVSANTVVGSAAELEQAIKDFNTANADTTLDISGDLTGLSADLTITGQGKLMLNLTGNVTVDKRLVVTGKTYLEMNLNSFTFKTVGVSAGGSSGTAIHMNNAESTIKMYNGRFESSDVGIWTTSCTCEIDNVVMYCYEEAIYNKEQSNGFKGYIKNSSISAISFYDAAEGFLIENCIITKCQDNKWYHFNQDCWDSNVKGDLVFRNVRTTDGTKLTINVVGGFQKVYIYDSDYVPGQCGEDSGGKAYVEVITSPTCTQEGKKQIYVGDKSTKVPTVTEETIPVIPHSIAQDTINGVKYVNYFENGYYVGECAMCNAVCQESEAKASALFVSYGYSMSESSKAVIQGFKVNREVLNTYFDDSLDFGVVVTGNKAGAELKPLELAEKVVFTSVVGSAYDVFQIKVSGFTDETCGYNVVFCAYVKNGDEVSYLDNKQTLESVTGISYDDVKALVDAK
ncbi:MAG: hypothetical protein J6B29_04900 [Clostridia bacterium]|nr:hypothetical protein [Clostridia bacterium]